jgi:hypothetical protein
VTKAIADVPLESIEAQKEQEEVSGEAKELEKELGAAVVIEEGSVTTDAPIQEASSPEIKEAVNE